MDQVCESDSSFTKFSNVVKKVLRTPSVSRLRYGCLSRDEYRATRLRSYVSKRRPSLHLVSTNADFSIAEAQEALAKLRDVSEEVKYLKCSRIEDKQQINNLRSHVSNLAEQRNTYYQGVDELMGQLHNAQVENHVFRGDKQNVQEQIIQSKKLISSFSYVAHQVSDEKIRTMSEQVFYNIQSFVAQNFLGSKLGRTCFTHHCK